MGSLLSSVVVDVIMKYFETGIGVFHFITQRNIDSKSIVGPDSTNTVDSFLKHFNEHHVDIQFTMEQEWNNSLPFIDKWMNFFDTSYYRPLRT